MTSELRLGEGEGMSHVETIAGRGGGHCKGADTGVCLAVSGATKTSVARAQGPQGEGEKNKVIEATKALLCEAFLGDFLGEETAEKSLLIPPPLYPTPWGEVSTPAQPPSIHCP